LRNQGAGAATLSLCGSPIAALALPSVSGSDPLEDKWFAAGVPQFARPAPHLLLPRYQDRLSQYHVVLSEPDIFCPFTCEYSK
jgi:hypothetical protein